MDSSSDFDPTVVGTHLTMITVVLSRGGSGDSPRLGDEQWADYRDDVVEVLEPYVLDRPDPGVLLVAPAFGVARWVNVKGESVEEETATYLLQVPPLVLDPALFGDETDPEAIRAFWTEKVGDEAARAHHLKHSLAHVAQRYGRPATIVVSGQVQLLVSHDEVVAEEDSEEAFVGAVESWLAQQDGGQ